MQIIPGDSTGVITMSIAPQTLGQILFASQAACRIFGYTRGQLERRDVSVLVPAPIAAAHSSLVARYVSTGQSTIIDRTRVMLGLHKSGHLIPVRPHADSLILL